jgi:hypothetical protein
MVVILAACKSLSRAGANPPNAPAQVSGDADSARRGAVRRRPARADAAVSPGRRRKRSRRPGTHARRGGRLCRPRRRLWSARCASSRKTRSPGLNLGGCSSPPAIPAQADSMGHKALGLAAGDPNRPGRRVAPHRRLAARARPQPGGEHGRCACGCPRAALTGVGAPIWGRAPGSGVFLTPPGASS